MRILTHAVHTSWEYELSKTGHDIYSVDLGITDSVWDEWQRPKPDNIKFIVKENINDGIGFYKEGWSGSDFDLILVHTKTGFDFFKHLKAPMIYKLHTIDEEKEIDEEIEKRVNFFAFNNIEASKKWILKDNSKKVIIEHSIDTNVFTGYKPNSKKVLCIGNKLPKRLDKGVENIKKLAEHYEVLVVGKCNEELKDIKGIELAESKELFDLANKYRESFVFFNPADTLPMSHLEAMATGMPTICFQTKNLKNLIISGLNGFRVDSFDQALKVIGFLQARVCVAKSVGERGRETIEKRFNPIRFQNEWNELFKKAVSQGYLQ